MYTFHDAVLHGVPHSKKYMYMLCTRPSAVFRPIHGRGVRAPTERSHESSRSAVRSPSPGKSIRISGRTLQFSGDLRFPVVVTECATPGFQTEISAVLERRGWPWPADNPTSSLRCRLSEWAERALTVLAGIITVNWLLRKTPTIGWSSESK